jgi:hypothetical protein
LTAAHCAEAILTFADDQSGTFEVGGQVYLTTRVVIHPDYNPATLTSDIAILELAGSVTDVAPLLTSLASPAVGDPVLLVGFGGQGTPEAGDDGSFGEKLVGTTTIDLVEDTVIAWEFDSVSESNAAPGDSGGPVLHDTGDEFIIVGIVSAGTRADAALGDIAFSTRVDAFATWIAETLAEPDDDQDDGDDDDHEKPDCRAGQGSGAEAHHTWGKRTEAAATKRANKPSSTLRTASGADRYDHRRRKPSGVYYRGGNRRVAAGSSALRSPTNSHRAHWR